MTRSWPYLAALLLSMPLAWAGEPAKATLKVEGMTCGGCVAAVKIQLKRTEGVTAYEVSLEKAEADVSYDSEKTTPEKIAESVSKTGFKASVKGKKDEGSGAKQGAFSPLDLFARTLELKVLLALSVVGLLGTSVRAADEGEKSCCENRRACASKVAAESSKLRCSLKGTHLFLLTAPSGRSPARRTPHSSS